MMNKKVMAVAVAGALALPGVALAQVTISGGFRMSLTQHSIGNVTSFGSLPAAALGSQLGSATSRYNATGAAQGNLSETRVADNVTQVIFQAREDLGGGLTAVGRFEWRPTMDGAGNTGGNLGSGTSAGTNFVGVESKTMGTLRFGSVTTYSGAGGTGGPFSSDRGLAFAGNVGITQQIGTGAVVAAGQTSATQQTNFGQGRHTNSITWNSPNWSGFTLTGVYSTQNAGNDADLATPAAGANGAARKGQLMVLAPGYATGGLSLQYIYMDNKVDGFTANAVASTTTFVTLGSAGAGAATGNGSTALAGAGGSLAVRDVKAHKAWATYNFGNGFALSGVWSRATLTNAYTGTLAQTNVSGGNKLSEKTVWVLTGKYATGPHTFAMDYTKAGSDKIVVNALGQTGNTGAKQWSANWMYELSKRTEVGLTYTKISNDTLTANGPQDTAVNALGATGTAGNNAGESYTIWGGNITHKF